MIQQSMSLKVLIFPISLVLAAVVAILFIKPAFSDMNAAKKDLTVEQASLESLKMKNEKLQAAKAKFNALAEEKNLVFSALPESDDVDTYVSEITSKANRSGVLLSEVSADKVQGGSEASRSYVCSENSGAGSSAGSAVAPAAVDGSVAPALPVQDCVEAVNASLALQGTWEQLLDFLKYLEDMNRISNISGLEIDTSAESGDVLEINISLSSFFKENSGSSNAAVVDNLAGQGTINQNALDRLKEIIYAPFAAPDVAPAGERNLFK
jgi:Tfp pilus assembly protein PilO